MVLFCGFLQLFPYLDHSKGIKLAVFKQISSCLLKLLAAHFFHSGECIHRLAAVMYAVKIMIVKTRVIREQSRQNALDREAAAHFSVVVPPRLKRNEQVGYIIPYAQKMLRKIREAPRKLLQPCTFKVLVVNSDAGIGGDIPAKSFSDRTQRICTRLRKKSLVLQQAALALYVMQRILEGYLCIRLRTSIFRYGRLNALKVEEVKRI